MGKKKIDIDQFEMDLAKGDWVTLKGRYFCETPGCDQTAVWWDTKKHNVKVQDPRIQFVDIGTDMGLVMSYCDHCGRRVCPSPHMKPLNGLPPLFCAPPPEPPKATDKIWKPGDGYKFSSQELASMKFGGGNRMKLQGDFQDTQYCLQEAIRIDLNDNIKVISCCRNKECTAQFEDDLRQIKRKRYLLGG